MKKIFTLTAVLLSAMVIGTAAFAAEPPHPNFGKVSIKSRSDAFIQVVIDGKQFNMNRNGFVMDNVRPGRHSIQIYKIDRRGFRNHSRMIYSSVMNVRPWELVDININRYERVSVASRIDPSDRYNGGYGRDDRYGRDNDHGHWGDRNDRDDRYGRY